MIDEPSALRESMRLEVIRPRVLALAFGQVGDVVIRRVGADAAAEDFGDVAAQLVHGRHHDVARRLVVELLDALAQIGLDDFDAAVFQEGPHLALVGQHRLALHQQRGLVRGHDLEHDLVVLGGVACPVHDGAIGLRVALELQQVVAQIRQRVFLDRRREQAKRFPLGHRLALAVALLAQVPQALVVEVGVVLRRDELRRGLGVVDALHSLAPFSTWAM